ncbi:TIGR04086 family membrane protein [Clostridium sp. JN-9]|uniref:TIGR04086 family membrane protein n=1 Tax=Clostridium sp. JN-9 TaxID=2507159 RepID=UPI001FAAAEDD|nr:TIGR04086 family membrane protein [Clostridium sp. JN-9]
MLEKNKFIFIAEGVLRGIILTTILFLVLASIMTFTEVNNSFTSVFYLLTTLVSIMYGAVYSAKKIQRKGWLVGLAMAIMYMIILYAVSIASNNSTGMDSSRIIRTILALVVGTLSGMLGINL